jgi:hypothetical protein
MSDSEFETSLNENYGGKRPSENPIEGALYSSLPHLSAGESEKNFCVIDKNHLLLLRIKG